MKKEQWDYIQAHWGDSDPTTMEEIAKIKDEDELERQQLQSSLDDAKEENRKLTVQNVEVNKTNMALILRLTDPKLPPNKEKEVPSVPAFSDYDAFVK